MNKQYHLLLVAICSLLYAPTCIAQTCDNSGIGISSPTSKLHIKGCTVDSTTSSLDVTDSNSTTMFFVNNNKRIGVNTDNPYTSLHIQSANTGGINLNNTIGDPLMGFYLNSITTPRFVLGVDSSDAKKFKIGTTGLTTNTRFTIDSTGNIGIGTTGPSSLLDIESGNAAEGIDINNTATSGDPIINFQLSGVTKFSMGVDDSNGDMFKIGTSSIDTDTRLYFDSDGGVGFGAAPGTYRAVLKQDSSKSGYGLKMINPNVTKSLQVWLGDSTTTFDAVGTDNYFRFRNQYGLTRMSITADGDVGFLTATPQAKLDVRGSAIFNTHAWAKGDIYIAGDTDEELFYTDGSADKIGISTATPDVSLDIESSSSGADGIDINSTATDGDPGIRFQLSGTTVFTMGVDDSDANKFKIGTTDLATNTRITIDTNGLVGIGTSNPSYQLELSLDSAAKPSTNTWRIISDERVKKDIIPFNDGLEVLKEINAVQYRYNGLAGTPSNNRLEIGIIAQQLDTVAPYCVRKIKKTLRGAEADDFPGDKQLIGTDTIHTLTRMDTVKSEGDIVELIPVYSTEVIDVYQGTLLGFDAHALFFVLVNANQELMHKKKQLEARLTKLESQ